MTLSPFKALGAALRWLWKLLDATRRVFVNVLLLASLASLAVTIAFFVMQGRVKPLEDKTALVLRLEGPLREQAAGSLRNSLLDELRDRDSAQTRLRDVLAALDAAAADPHVHRVLLLTDDLAGAGSATLREVAAAIGRVRAAGKPVTAWGSGFDQRQYYLAAHCDEVWMHPMGAALVEGFGGRRTYFKDVLDKLGVTAHVVRAGQYKNAAETFVANGPSPQTMEADKLLYDGLWADYAGAVEKARKLPPGGLQATIDALPGNLVAAGGDAAKLALDLKWVDALKTRDELRDAFIERGVKEDKTFRQTSAGGLLARHRPPTKGDAIGVVVAEGNIVDGRAPAGTIGGLSTAELVRAAREDEQIKAVVLRVNSPGGSAFGAELVRRELELTRKAGKPVVVSMGDVAASGGYWISMAADEVIADPATITGSIGVIALLPTAENLADKVGLHSGGYATSWLRGAYDLKSGLDPRMEKIIQASVDNTYGQFTALVAGARKTTPDKIDAVGQGRVWTGAQALERGLVDRTGSLDDALKAAAARAKLPKDARVQYLDREPSRLERIAAILRQRTQAWLGDISGPELPGLQTLRDEARSLAVLMQPGANGRVAAPLVLCLCGEP